MNVPVKHFELAFFFFLEMCYINKTDLIFFLLGIIFIGKKKSIITAPQGSV